MFRSTNLVVTTALVVFSPNYTNAFQQKSGLAVQLPARSVTKRDAFLIKEPNGASPSFPSFFGTPDTSSVKIFYDAWNERDYQAINNFIADECVYEDAKYSGPFVGRDDVMRHFQLAGDVNDKMYVVDDFADGGEKVAVKYHIETIGGETEPCSRHVAFFTVDTDSGLITSVFDTVEPSSKTGATDLAVLSAASKILRLFGSDESGDAQQIPKQESTTEEENKGFFENLFSTDSSKPMISAPERYFAAWNQRDMDAAVQVFADDCQYEDTVFPEPFDGKQALKKHLLLCEESLPSTFSFVIDDIADAGDKLGVKWHVENNGEQMPFTRGLSFYTVDVATGLVKTGIDEVEPAVLKLGAPSLLVETMKAKISEEPVRLVPLVSWVAYMYIVFFSDGILPGANALQLEQRTWEEVLNLSLNFFFVSPLLNLPFAPVVHPMLEGVFNLLLSWAALFAGFFGDEREDKPNIFPVLPTVVGMQFLTSAFLLPYLTLRSSENLSSPVSQSELSKPAQIVESRLFAPFLGTVGTGAFFWGTLARFDDFGGWNERVASFWDLMSVDRVGSSFLVDLAIFAVFQGWLIDDDLRRRGIADDECTTLRNAAKYLPFFGMVVYMTVRPAYTE